MGGYARRVGNSQVPRRALHSEGRAYLEQAKTLAAFRPKVLAANDADGYQSARKTWDRDYHLCAGVLCCTAVEAGLVW